MGDARPRIGALAAVAMAMAASCVEQPEGFGGPCVVTEFSLHGTPVEARRLDMVVLIDDSSSMGLEQQTFLERFPQILADLLAFPRDADGDTCPDNLPLDDLNVAVLRPDLGSGGFAVPGCPEAVRGDDGCFRRTPLGDVPGCAGEYPSSLLLDERNRATYSPSQLAADFTCLATLGTQGCGFEQSLEATLRSLTTQAEDGACNAGFRRPGVPLALVFVTDEDDCSVAADHPEMFDPARTELGSLQVRCALHPESLRPVTDYVRALRSLVDPDRYGQLMVGMIVGVPPDEYSCTGSGDGLTGCLEREAMQVQVYPAGWSSLAPACWTDSGKATPARRFVELATRLGPEAQVASICDPDSWTRMFRDLVSPLFMDTLMPHCFPRDLHFDPESCRASCVVVETLTDDRSCESGVECPQAWCPPASAGDAVTALPCADPATGRTCTPLKRDLGTVRRPDGSVRRQCLVRQAERPASAGGCGPPVVDGWYYVPADAGWFGCPELIWGDVPASCCRDERGVLEAGSEVDLFCWRMACAERECGPPEDPSAVECREDQYCVRPGVCRSGWE